MRVVILALMVMLIQSSPATSAVTHSAIDGAVANMNFLLLDESGRPLTNILAHAWFSFFDADKNFYKDVRSDMNGRISISHACNRSCGIWFAEKGYYRGRVEVDFTQVENQVVKYGRWTTPRLSQEIVVKKKDRIGTLNVLPKEMIRPRWTIPCQDKWIGFDLCALDWIPPYGNGSVADFKARFRIRKGDALRDFSYRMEIDFSSSPCSGFYIKNKSEASVLKWDARANSNDVFRTHLSYVSEKGPSGQTFQSEVSDEQYLVFRTRTKIDDKGNLVAANYGVISGPWTAGSHTMGFADAVFNPNPNDTSLEDSRYLRNEQHE